MVPSIRTVLAVVAACLFLFGPIHAQEPPPRAGVAALSPSDPMPVDAAITQGTLPNGLRYYVRSNKKPEKRAELRLAKRTLLFSMPGAELLAVVVLELTIPTLKSLETYNYNALLGIAECLEVTGRERIANLVRSVTMSIEQTVSDLRHDLLHVKHRPKTKLQTRRKRKTAILIRRDRSKRASSVKHPPEAPTAVRVRPARPSN